MMKHLKTTSMMLFLALVMVVGMSSQAFAIALAGDPISNQATLDYEVGGVGQPPVLSDDPTDPTGNDDPTVFTVDSKVDLTMAATSVNVSGTDNLMTFTVTNTGNDIQAYELEFYQGTVPGENDFNMENVRVYIDTNRNGALDVGTDTLLATDPANGASLGTTVDIYPEDDYKAVSTAYNDTNIQVFVLADVPSGTADTLTSIYTIKALTYDSGAGAETGDASTGTGGVDVVLADTTAAAGGVGGVTDAALNGDFYATGTFTVNSAALSITKTVNIVWDPINLAVSPQPIPGALAEYTITITNSGAAAATAVEVVDPIPSNTDYYVTAGVTASSGTATFSDDNGVTYAAVPAAGANGEDASITHVKVDTFTVDASGGANDTVTITFQVVIE
jgi:uncharacterized repeat protein (TIGR01451 family)